MTVLAELLDVPNTDQAAGYGVVAFASTTVLVIVKRP